jgi:hypothetical protein
MKPSLLLMVVLFGAGTVAQSPSDKPGHNSNQPDVLVGAWRLVALEEPDTDGTVRKADCDGMFVFTRDGRASVQVMYRNAPTGSAYTQGGYEASYGSYRIDNPSTFTFQIEGALVRTLIGKSLKRHYEVSGNRLTVKSDDANEHWRVVWERY